MKKCPYCAEEIQDAAIVCRYCGRDLQAPSKLAPKGEKSPSKKNNSIWLGALIIFLIICGIIRGPAEKGANETGTSTRFAEGANSSVVIITYTPLATNTPKPTRTPAATRTPRPTADAYRLVAQQKLIGFMEAYSDVNKCVQQVAEDTTLILDKDWKTKTGLALGVLNFRADEMAELEPTPDYEKFHTYIIEITKETHLFTEAYAKGIDNLDSDSIITATEHLSNMTTLMENATLELESINNNP